MNFFQDVGFLSDALRFIFCGLDNLGYFLLDAVYDIFFTVSNANIFQGTAINTFYSRIQLILGVFMIFMLSIAFLQMIVNPDLAKDKQKGAGSLVKRIAVSLVLLTLIVPVTIEDTNGNPLNEQINSNGILFGFLYQIQNTVIQDNVLGKLVLGSNSEASNGTELSNIADVGSQMAATVAKAFIRPSLGDVDEDSVTDNDTYETNVACQDQAAPYFNSRVTAGSLVNHVNDTCDYNGNEIYVFDYAILGGLLCSIIMVLIILGFTIDVAVRAVKLAILRLIAPIPIISYISPGQEKDGAFNNWVKTLTSTYISLFVRLIIIYFGIYLIIILTDSNNDFSLLQSSTSVFTSFFATIFIIIGILMFMKEAPKFFQDMLGLKGDGKLFSGVGTILGAAALTGGLAGSVATGVRAGWAEGAELRDKAQGRFGKLGRIGGGILTGAGAGLSGLTSGIGGAFVGTKALATSDKKVPSSVISAMQKRNAMRASHSTLPGRISSSAADMFTGLSLAERDQQLLDLNKEAASQAKTLKGLEEEEALKFGDYGEITLRDGTVGQFNYSDLSAAMQSKDTNGDFTYNGRDYNVSLFGNNEMEAIKKAQTIRYTQGHVAAGVQDGDRYVNNGKIRSQKRQTDYAFRQAGGKAAETYGNGDYNNLGKAIGAANEIVTDMSTNMKNVKHRANHNANKNK